MLEFHEVTMADREWVSKCFHAANQRGSEYTFANLFNWSKAYTMRIAPFDGFVIPRSGSTVYHYMYPAGQGDWQAAFAQIEEDAKQNKMPLSFYGIPADGIERMETLYPGRFTFKPIRDNFDYLYLQESLSTLAGKKLHGKRNHINRFIEQNPDWSYEQITRGNIDEAWAMCVEWCKDNSCFETHSLQREACAVKSAFEHYFEQQLVGGLLRAGGRVVAFTFGSPSTDDTFVVHVEKAFSEIQGAYPMINQQFVRNELSQYTYVNREDDLGEEGLRRAKESYRPAMMYERYAASEKR